MPFIIISDDNNIGMSPPSPGLEQNMNDCSLEQNNETPQTECNIKIESSGNFHSEATSNLSLTAPGGLKPQSNGFDTRLPIFINEFDRFIGHEDFRKFLDIATKVKAMRHELAAIGRTSPVHPCPVILTHNSQCIDIDATTRFIQSAIASGASGVPRGAYPQTDSIIDEAILLLEQEFERCLAFRETLKESKGSRSLKRKRKEEKEGKGEAIAVKYSKTQTDILTDWMIVHRTHPFPDAMQIKILSEATNLTYSQVVNWTTNVRKRNLKATVEGGKKPHHFLDFLFLAADREKRYYAGLDGKPISRRGRRSPTISGSTAEDASVNTTTLHTQERPDLPASNTYAVSATHNAAVPEIALPQCGHPITPISNGFFPHVYDPITGRFRTHYASPGASNTGMPSYYGAPPQGRAHFAYASYYSASHPYQQQQQHPHNYRNNNAYPSFRHEQQQQKRGTNEADESVRAVSPADEASSRVAVSHSSMASLKSETNDAFATSSGGTGDPNGIGFVYNGHVTDDFVDCSQGPNYKRFKEDDDFWQSTLLNAEKVAPGSDEFNIFGNNNNREEKEVISEFTKGGIVSTPTRCDEEDEFFWNGMDTLPPAVSCEDFYIGDCSIHNSDSHEKSETTMPSFLTETDMDDVLIYGLEDDMDDEEILNVLLQSDLAFEV